MAKLKLEINIPDHTVEKLQLMVQAIDAGEDVYPIDAANVRASDVWMLINTLDLNVDFEIKVDEMVEGPKCIHPQYPDGCHWKNCPNKGMCEHVSHSDQCDVKHCWNYGFASDPQYLFGS